MDEQMNASPEAESLGSNPKKKAFWSFRKKDQEVDYEALVMAGMPEEIRNRKPIATICLIAASAIMAIVTLSNYGSLDPDPQAYISLGANINTLTFGGQLWRLLTSSFLHFGLKHIAFNMLCLFSIGLFLEKLVGHAKLISIYILTAITGGILSCMFHDNVVCAGASGAVFGLFGATVSYIALVYKDMGIEVQNVVGYMKNGLIFLGINFVYSLMPDVDMAGHIGGLLGGLVVGGVLGAPLKWKDTKNADWYSRGVIIVTAIVAAIMMITCFTGGNAGRLGTKELAAEVGKLLKEKMIEGIKDAGGEKVDVEVQELTLFHDGGDNYHGLVIMMCKYSGETEKVTKSIKVTYDGEQFMYQLED